MEALARAFLFCDLREYTAFIEGAGDQAAADLIRRFRELIRSQLAAYDGAELKTEGDSFYIVFPAASRAIAFGVDVLRGAEGADGGMRFGIGIHAGETVPLDGQFIGSAVNLAARIGAMAGEGELLITDTVRGLVRTNCPYPLLDRGRVALKGIAEPVQLYAVEWKVRVDEPRLIPPPITEPLLSPELIGRERELAALSTAAEELAGGRGRIVAIGGSAGVGKSRLLREWSTRAEGLSVLVGACGATDARPLYEPFVGMLRQLTRSSVEEARLRRISPELVALLPELAGGERSRQSDRDALFGAFLRLVRDYARMGPFALVMEDAHWADDATLALFRFLAAEAAVTPYLLVATYRDEELNRGHPLRPLLADLSRRQDATHLSLRPLDAAASRELLARLNVPGTIGEVERERIAALAEGNPLFIEELARSAAGDMAALPLSIAEAVLRRVAALDEGSRRLVTYAAVTGQRVGFDLLERLLATDEREVLHAARAAIEQSLLVETEDGVAFRHALVREAVYRDLMRREQRLLHREIAEALVSLRGDDPASAREIELQFLEAGAPREALPYALAAGGYALGLLASAEAVTHFERAVDAAPPGSIDRGRALEGLGNAYRLHLEVAKAAQTLRDALALYREIGTKDDLVRAQSALARALPYGPDEWRAWKESWGLAEDAAPTLRFQIANVLADRAYQFMDDEEARRWSAVANELAERAGGERLLVAARRTRLEIEHPPGWHVESERIHAEHLERAIAHDEGVLAAYRRYLDSRCREATANERDALLARARAYADAHAPGVPRTVIFRFGQPWISWLTGEWDRAEGMWRELQQRFAREDQPDIFPDTGPVAAAIRIEMEGPDAGVALRAATERQTRTATWHGRLAGASHFANLQLAEGRPRAVLDELAPLVAGRGPQSLELPAFLLASRAVLAAALLARDARAVAPWVAADAALRTDGALFGATLDHAKAVASLLAGDAETARERFADAADTYRRLGWEHLATELAWQRARAGDESDLPAARAFCERRGAGWRARWLAEGKWR